MPFQKTQSFIFFTESLSSKPLVNPNGARSSSKTGSSHMNQDIRGQVIGIRTKSASGMKKRIVNNNNDIKSYEKKVTFLHENHLKKLKMPASTINETTKNLAGDYAARLQRMQERLDKEIHKNNMVKDGVKVPKKIVQRKLTIEEKVAAEIEEKNKATNAGIDLDLFPEQDKKPKVDVYSYERSKRAVEFRVLDKLDEDLSSCKNDKFQLVKKMNDKMIELDKLNEDKRTLSAQLINQIKFVRELQTQLGTSDNGHITEVIDKELEEQFKKEKYINVQLKEKLKECELEKLQIIEQLKFLEGQKDVTIVTKSDNHVDLEKSSMNIDEMIKYRSKIIKDNEEIQKDLRTLSLEEDRAAGSIEDLKRQVNQVSDERRHYANQIQKQQHFFDDGTSMISRDKNDLYYELRRQRLMLGGKVLSNAITKAINSRKKEALDQFTIAMKWNDQQIGSILAFRKLLIKYEQHRLAKGIHQWYRQSLKPVRLLRLNEVVVHHQLKHEPLRKMIIKWNHQKIISQKVSSSQVQIISKCLHKMINFNQRAIKYTFSVWRTNSNNKTLAKSKMASFMRDKINYKILQAFKKWKAVELHQDYSMRVHNMCVRSAVKQYSIQLFNGWRQVTVRLKSERINLAIRVIMCLRKNVEKKRQKTRYISMLLRQKKTMDAFYLKAAWNGLKFHKENTKYDLVAKILQQDCKVAIELAYKGLSNHRTQAMATRLKRKLNILFSACGRQLNANFQKWKQTTFDLKAIHREHFKAQLYHMWRGKLQKAFKIWHDGGHHKVRRKKMMMVDSQEYENQLIEDEVKKVELKIAVQDVRSINKGNVRANKIMKKIYCKQIGKWFNLWHQQMKHYDHKGDKLERIVIKKLERRILKSWLYRFKDQAKLVKILNHGEVKAEDYANILNYNSKKRMFKSIKTFVHNHKIAKRAFQRAFTISDVKTKKLYFCMWHGGHHAELKEDRKNHQNQLVEEIQQKNLTAADHQNLCSTQEKQIAAQTQQRESMHQKTIAKCISQFSRYRQYAAIMKWRKNLAEYKEHYSKIKHSFIQRMLHRQQFAAFHTWSRNGTIQHRKKKKMMIEEMQSEQQAEKTHISEIQQSKKLVKEVQSTKKQSEADQSNYNLKKYRNVVSKIISQKNNLVGIRRIEHIFNLWANFTQDKRRHVLRLEQLILKNHHQIAFDAVRVHVYSNVDKSGKDKKLIKAINLWLKRRQMMAVHKWKEQLFEHAKAKHQQIEETLFHKVKNDGFQRLDCQKSITKSQIYTGKQNIAKKVIIALFDYKCKKKFSRKQHQESQEKIQGLRGRQAVQIWIARYKVTKVQKMKKVNLLYTIGNRKMREVWKALNQNYQIKRTIVKTISNADRVMRKHNLEMGFAAIMHAKNLKNKEVAYGFRLADTIINKMIARHIRKRIVICLMRMKISAVGLRKRDKILKSVVKTRWVNRFRKYFNTYRRHAQLQEVVVFCNELGPIRLEKNRIDRDKKNLVYHLVDDGYTLLECNKIIDDNNERFKALTEKSLCRLYCSGATENATKLLPWCFDKLLQFKKERKSYGYWFNLLELRSNMHKTDLMFAFEKWRMVRGNRQKILEIKKYNFLLETDKLNLIKIAEQANEMQAKHAIIDDIKEQRTFLIGKVISAQRLALDRCNHSYKKALEHAWRHWVHHKHQHIIRDHHQQTHQNLGHKDNLKERQEYLHNQNHHLAEENDKLKEGALHSVSMMSTAEELQKEIEKQSHVLTDRASTIRTLLETNAKLTQKLKLANLNKHSY